MRRPRNASTQRVLVALALLVAAAPMSARAATLLVGPSQTYTTPCAAAAVAQDGDIVEIDAGTYTGDVCAWSASDLTIRGVGGHAHLEANGQNAQGKATWVIDGDNTTIEWIEFSGATVPDENGAGIRLQGTGLTVRHCWFHDNENGILAGDNDQSDVLIEYTEFNDNGFGDGQTHNLYINHVRSLVFRYNYSHHSIIGHQLKSRAHETHVLYNRIGDEAGGDGSYQINVPNGGRTIIVGNQIHQSDVAGQGGIISVGEEGASNPVQELYVVNNTIVNDRHAGTFVRNATGAQAVVTNNLFVGPGTVLDGPGTVTTGLETDTPGLVDQAGYDYHLLQTSAAVDAGSDPGNAGAFDLWPDRHYVHPLGDEARPVVDALDIGAYEYGEAPGDDDTGDDDSGDDDGGDDDGGDDDGGDDDGGDDDGGDDDSGDDGGDDDAAPPGDCQCRMTGAATAVGTTVPLLALAAIATIWARRRRGVQSSGSQ